MIEVYTPAETAEMLKISLSTVRRMIAEGRLQACKVGNQYRISESAIEVLLGTKKTAFQKKFIKEVLETV